MPFTPGYEEDGFLRQLDIQPGDAQPLAANCTLVMVWHTKTHTSRGPADMNLTKTKKFKNSNLAILLASLWNVKQHISKFSTYHRIQAVWSQMPDAKPQIKLAVEERKQIAWMSWNQSFACDFYKLIVIFAENMYKVKASFFSFSPSGVSLRCGDC